MRILHVLNHTGRFSGNVHAAIDLACAQSDSGDDVAICSSGGDFDDLCVAHGIKMICVPFSRTPLSAIRTINGIGKSIRGFKPDVVHAHMMASAVLSRFACSFARVPLVTTIHNAFQKAAILMAVGDRVIAVSSAVAAAMRARGVPKRRTRVVLNGTIGAARLESMTGAPDRTLDPLAVVFVGGLHPRKGLGDLFSAFEIVTKQIATARLHIVGEGPCEETYRADVQRMAIAHLVTFHGAVKDPRPFLRAADLFVLPSHADPAPLVISEAREAGCAIVATAVDGIPEMLEDGAAGILVPPKNPASLAASMISVLKNPEELAAYKLRSQVNIGRLSVQRVAAETAVVYRECLR